MTRIATCAVIASLAAALGAQGPTLHWGDTDRAPSQVTVLMHDAPKDRLLALSPTSTGLRTWSFDGSAWRLHNPGGMEQYVGWLLASPLAVHVVGYDEARGQAVLVPEPLWSGSSPTLVTHGAGWALAAQHYSPAARNASASFDPQLGGLVTFGGLHNWQPTDWSFFWDGTSWTQLTPTVSPSARHVAAMATDRARGRVVLFGGDNTMQILGDTWEWDGANWSQLHPALAPSARVSTMSYDPARQRTVLLGGFESPFGNPVADCWEWDGAQWTSRGNLPQHWPSAAACDDGNALWIATGRGDLWRASGTGWTSVWTRTDPTDRAGALTYDPARNEAVLVSGYGPRETWAWDGSWQLRSTGGPVQRLEASVAPLGSEVVLFGGTDPTYQPLYLLFDHTWHFDGTSWTQRNPPTSPPPRSRHAMVEAGGELLLFGGRGALGLLDDTWSYDGVDWTQRSPTTSPSARETFGLAYDPLRQRAVLSGGFVAGLLQDTWEWDGANWIPFPAALQPNDFTYRKMAFDGAAVVLAQGTEMWAWTGSNWNVLQTVGTPPLYPQSLAHDAGRQRLLLLAGSMHVLGPTPARATITEQRCGNALDLRLFGRPTPGSAPAIHVEGQPSAVAAVILGLQPLQHTWAAGCEQMVRPDATLLATLGSFGQLDHPLVLPADPALRGLNLHVQAAVLDGGPVFGASLSGALHLRVGD